MYVNRDQKPAFDGTRHVTASIIAHELFDHSYQIDKGTVDLSRDPETGIRQTEIDATRVENIYRKADGLPIREAYGGRKLPEFRCEQEDCKN